MLIDVVANPAVNLTADTDVDGSFNAADDALEDDAIGKLVFVNDDDDDGDLVKDNEDSGAVTGEDDLAEVQINIPASFDGMMARLTVEGDAGSLRLWSAADRTGTIGSMTDYIVGQDPIPASVYVEGLETGVATLRLEMLDPMSGAVLFKDGAKVADDLKHRISHVALDVTDDYVTGDEGDGFWDYMPGYRGATPMLSSGAFNAQTPLTPQPLHAIYNGLGTETGVGKITASLTGISEHTGYAENEPDPADGLLDNMDDVSFSSTEEKTRTDTNAGGGVGEYKAWINFYVRDYAATANYNTWVYDAGGITRGNHSRQVVRDTDKHKDGLQDGWEEQSVAEFAAQFNVVFTDPALTVFSGETHTDSDENEDPDMANADGGRNLGTHKSRGDSLTPFQEYRGFILDGGGFDGAGLNGHAGGHKRLSPALKELLVEVDTMPKANVVNMPTAARLKTIMEGVAKGFSDKDSGAGIRTYWVVDEPSAAHKAFTGTKDEADAAIRKWMGDHRNKSQLGEFVHLGFVGTHPTNNYGGYSSEGLGAVIFTGNNPGTSNVGYSQLVTHELTHTLLNTIDEHGFNGGEHMDDPDPSDPPKGPKDAIYIMHEYDGNHTLNNSIVFHDLELAQIDLTSKESVER